MAYKVNIPTGITGLSTPEVTALRTAHGTNTYAAKRPNKALAFLGDLLKEPMLLLLIAVSIIYFTLAQWGEAYFMLAAIVLVSGISFYTENRSNKALAALKKINQPSSKVLRDGRLQSIPTEEIVQGDVMFIAEGDTVNADGSIIHSNDFSVNESTLTGEAFTVYKDQNEPNNQVYSGTLVAGGAAFVRVDKVGIQTKIGQLGNDILTMKEEPTLLQQQITHFVKVMAIIGLAVFLAVWAVNFYRERNLVNSLLKGLTLAMSILPEEIPVAFSTFMALGARRLMQLGIIVKKIKTVEALGSATVICTDKTGTITENSMHLQAIYIQSSQESLEAGNWNSPSAQTLLQYAMWSSEPVPFDPMEKTLHSIYEKIAAKDERPLFSMVHEYPLDGTPPMMTHIFEHEQTRIIAAKGAPEAILEVSNLSEHDRETALQQLTTYASQGFRVLGVARGTFTGNDFPARQQDVPFEFLGFVAFYDPPKANIKAVFEQFYEAGIKVKIITGDNALTTRAIAQQAGLRHPEEAINGDELMALNEPQRQATLLRANIFTRMFPNAKLAAINALKDSNEIVAMTGDGVNDGPALKAAHIGIAMGKKGTEIAKQAAALILVNDDLSGMVDAVAMGRRIYTNIRKAVLYIIAIHIPIILTVSLPLFLGWLYPNIFTPMHVIFLELVMGPTCSIVYENEPMERNLMHVPPRPINETFLSGKELMVSILQGLVITAFILGIYQYCVQSGESESITRSMVFTTLICANIWLTMVNRSFYFSFITSMQNRNYLLPAIIAATLLITIIILYVPPVAGFFSVAPLSGLQVLICALAGAFSVLWMEGVKWWRRRRKGV
ncbi:Ca2+-transporting ATPase [Chitinophaga skermanii]|uniref:Ca2+-transporting ATPase n=1 Tax=Chitinophaga skermanii TaxID=331697 RepID=A0A327QD21_9BACT|nr:cation-translocating P-type ATPase [Chitinophaga skermanii]RAJ02380.1 Ca2+-transporting ATPase [Chitinophaga skermanii]